MFNGSLVLRSLNNPNFFFIQIGSCEGIVHDPIRNHVIRYHWSGVLVEPVKYLFDKLVDNYKNEKNLMFENSAISQENGSRDFYRIRESNDPLPYWYHQLGSFYLSNILKHKNSIPDIEDRIVTEKIPTLTLKRLIEKYNIKSIDLLHIDAEGYDYEILKQIASINIKPKMILFENQHLSNADREASGDLLKKEGYSILEIAVDTFAFL